MSEDATTVVMEGVFAGADDVAITGVGDGALSGVADAAGAGTCRYRLSMQGLMSVYLSD